MSRGSRARAAVAALVAISAGIGLVATATAGTTRAGKFRYVQRSFDTPPRSQSKRQVARCPRGTHVYGGGTSAAQTFGEGVVNASYPIDLGDRGAVPDDGWAVSYDNYLDAPEDSIVTAVCGRATPKYRRVRTRIGAGRYKTFTANCPRGTFVWGGGATNRGPFNSFYLSQTFPNGTRSWTSTLGNVSTAPFDAFAFAICGTRKPRYVRDSTTAVPESSALWDADCPNQLFHLISGGASHAAPGQIAIGNLNPADADLRDAAPDDEMTASFHNYANSSHRVTVHAVCLR